MTTTSLYSKMLASDMIAILNLGPLQPLELPTSMNYLMHANPYPQDYSSTGTTYGGIDMPGEEFYQVHTTNLNRPPNVSTITPRKPTAAPPTGRPTPRRSPGPIFLPANIYKLLSGAQKAQCNHQIHPSTQKGCQYP